MSRPEGPSARHNLDGPTVRGFGEEWTKFDQVPLGAKERDELFQQYFDLVDWSDLPPASRAFDLGCGSGRWALGVAPRVGTLHCIDASGEALAVARRTLAGHANCEFHQASVDALPLSPASMDFGYSLGVLHHVPDTAAGLGAAAACLKPGAPLLVYLYYAFDNRPAWYRLLWRASDGLRRVMSALPFRLRYAVSQVVAAAVYWPCARTAAVAERLGVPVESFPLAFYRHRSFYVMRTDALDRLGTRLEQRFSREEIRRLLTEAGLERVRFSETPPYWCALGYRRAEPARP